MRTKSNKGFALLIAVVVSTIILTIAISIVNTAIAEVILASTVRNSLTSFYLADTGAECALFWDNIRGSFTDRSAFEPGAPTRIIECSGIRTSVEGGSNVQFWIRNDAQLNAPCSQVTVESTPVDPSHDNVKINAWGFNTCDESSSKRVDRALEVKYGRFH